LRSANRKTAFRIIDTRPKVRIFIGKKTIEKMGFIRRVISQKPPIRSARLLGLFSKPTTGKMLIVV